MPGGYNPPRRSLDEIRQDNAYHQEPIVPPQTVPAQLNATVLFTIDLGLLGLSDTDDQLAP
jgi:hypothetical protein